MHWNAVGPDYFRTLETPLLFGRDFTESDSPSAPKVAIINETFALRYLPNQNPLGHHIPLSHRPDAPQSTIPAVAPASKYIGVRAPPLPLPYFPYQQIPHISTP